MGCGVSKAALELQDGAEHGEEAPGGPSLEALRLRAVRECRALDTAAEAKFQTITNLLQSCFKVPIAVVGLIEADHLDLISRAGTDATTVSRLHSFCDASLRLPRPTMMVVEDTRQDARFQHAELVEGPPNVRFYAGSPLVSSCGGHILGSLGIMDLVPRSFPADMYTMICNFAELVVRELERDKAAELELQQAARLAQRQQGLARALSCFREAIAFCYLSSGGQEEEEEGGWRVVFANDAWEERLGGAPAASPLPHPMWDRMAWADPKQRQVSMFHAQVAISQRQPFKLLVVPRANPGAVLQLSFRPATNDHLSDARAPLIGIPSFVESAQGAGGGSDGEVFYFATAEEYIPEPSTPATSPRDVVTRPSHAFSLATASCLSSSSYGGTPHACFGLEQPAALGDLVLGPLLGRGSFGRVYRGLWHGTRVAVKVLDSWVEEEGGYAVDGVLGGEEAALARGPLLEALLSRELEHPQVVQALDFVRTLEQGGGIQDDLDAGLLDGGSEGSPEGPSRPLQRFWIVQEYCNRGTLYDALDRGWLRTKRDLDGPTNMLALLQTAQEVASALGYLHSCGILHGDVTGNNVLLTSSAKDGRHFTAKVADFGVARALAGDTPLETGTLGAVSHMPPEALRDGILTKAADVWSFGVLLWELFCHKRAWCGMRVSQVVYHVASLGKKPQLPPEAPEAYRALTEACLSSDRAMRPTFTEVLEALEAMLAEAARQGSG